MPKPISVLLVDDNPTFLRVATRFLQEHCNNEVEVIGVAGGGRQALTQAVELQPQVVVLDLIMPDLHGLKVIPLLREVLPEVGIIILTLHDIDSYREAALEAGADAFVPKAALTTNLLPTIRQVARTGGPGTVAQVSAPVAETRDNFDITGGG